MKVRFTAAARRQLREVGDRIAQDSPRRALTFVAEIEGRCRNLSQMPERFPLVPGREEHGVRRTAVGNYLIFYRVEANAVVVLHIVHGARDIDALLLGP